MVSKPSDSPPDSLGVRGTQERGRKELRAMVTKPSDSPPVS